MIDNINETLLSIAISSPKKRLKALHNLHIHTYTKKHTHMHAHTYTHTHTHTHHFLTKYLGGGEERENTAPTVNIKYMYNDENNPGKRKQNS